MLPPLGNVELCFLLVQAVLLYRILRDLNLIDLDRLLAVIKPPDGSTALVSMGGDGSTCISDEALTKEQRQTFVKLNSGGSRGSTGTSSCARSSTATTMRRKPMRCSCATARGWTWSSRSK